MKSDEGKNKNPELTGIRKKLTVWNLTRITFYLNIFFWIITSFDFFMESFLFAFLWGAIMISNIVLSIMHLNKYDKKTFAVISLAVSSFTLILFLLGAIVGVVKMTIENPNWLSFD